MRVFFSNIPNILAEWFLFGSMYYFLKFCHCVSIVHNFIFLPQKGKIFIHFIGFSIWDWNMDLGAENLGSDHHVKSSDVNKKNQVILL